MFVYDHSGAPSVGSQTTLFLYEIISVSGSHSVCHVAIVAAQRQADSSRNAQLYSMERWAAILHVPPATAGLLSTGYSRPTKTFLADSPASRLF